MARSSKFKSPDLNAMVLVAALTGALVLSSCAPLAGDRVVTNNGGQVEISQLGEGAPVIVFESGLTSYKEVWNKVFEELSGANTVFAYDRPGVGRSSSTSRPRDGATIVEDLRDLLRRQHLQPPYVLVGHSVGGLYMQLYARRHPEEVAGLVLVDPTHPTQFAGAGSMANRSMLSRLAKGIAVRGDAAREFEALGETGAEVLSSPTLSAAVPTIILSAPEHSSSAIAHFDNAKRRDFRALYPTAEFHELDGGHDVPQAHPEAVLDAIRRVLAQASANRRLRG